MVHEVDARRVQRLASQTAGGLAAGDLFGGGGGSEDAREDPRVGRVGELHAARLDVRVRLAREVQPVAGRQ